MSKRIEIDLYQPDTGDYYFLIYTISSCRTEVVYVVYAPNAEEALNRFFSEEVRDYVFDFNSCFVTAICNFTLGTTHFFGMSGFRWSQQKSRHILETEDAAMDCFNSFINDCVEFEMTAPGDVSELMNRLLKLHQRSGALLTWYTRHQVETEPSPSTPQTTEQ